jgi:methionyl aminopeptidase
VDETNGKATTAATKNGDIDHEDSDDDKEDAEGAAEPGATGG